MTMAEIKAGDVVIEVARYWPIPMTVVSVVDYHVTCKWFDGEGELHTRTFLLEQLSVIC